MARSGASAPVCVAVQALLWTISYAMPRNIVALITGASSGIGAAAPVEADITGIAVHEILIRAAQQTSWNIGHEYA